VPSRAWFRFRLRLVGRVAVVHGVNDMHVQCVGWAIVTFESVERDAIAGPEAPDTRWRSTGARNGWDTTGRR